MIRDFPGLYFLTNEQPPLLSAVKSRRLSLFGHMDRAQ